MKRQGDETRSSGAAESTEPLADSLQNMTPQPKVTLAGPSFSGPLTFGERIAGTPLEWAEQKRARLVKVRLEIYTLNRSNPELRLQLPINAFSLYGPEPDLLLCQEKYWEFQNMRTEDCAASKVGALLSAFQKEHAAEWRCCGWKNDAIAELVLGNLGAEENGKKAAEGWLKQLWRSRQKQQRALKTHVSEKRTAARKAASELDDLHLIDDQESWLNSIDSASQDPESDLLELLEKRRSGEIPRPVGYTDYVDLVEWLNKNRKRFISKKGDLAPLAIVIEVFRRARPKNVLSDTEIGETYVAYHKVKSWKIKGSRRVYGKWVYPPRNRAALSSYPVVLKVVARRHGVSSRLVTQVRSQSKAR